MEEFFKPIYLGTRKKWSITNFKMLDGNNNILRLQYHKWPEREFD